MKMSRLNFNAMKFHIFQEIVSWWSKTRLYASGYVPGQRNSELTELSEPMQHWKCPILKKWPPRGHGSHCFAVYILFNPWTRPLKVHGYVRRSANARRIANFTPKTNHRDPVVWCSTVLQDLRLFASTLARIFVPDRWRMSDPSLLFYRRQRQKVLCLKI